MATEKFDNMKLKIAIVAVFLAQLCCLVNGQMPKPGKFAAPPAPSRRPYRTSSFLRTPYPESKVLRHLEGKKSMSRPLNQDGNSTTLVKFELQMLPCLELTASGVLTANVWATTKYTDPSLVWNPKHYSGIDQVIIPATDIWLPDIALFNNYDMSGPMFPYKHAGDASDVVVTSDGGVLFVNERQFRVLCSRFDVLRPWSPVNCTLSFGSWTRHGGDVDIQIGAEPLQMGRYTNDKCSVEVLNFEAKREAMYYGCCEDPFITVYYHLGLQRNYVIKPDGTILKNPNIANDEQAATVKP